MRLVFMHGWGFDATLWDKLADQLREWPSERLDRGYFGAPRNLSCEAPHIAIAHSFAAMRLVRNPPASCRGLVAINGFDRLVAGSGFAGVAPRVLDRMIARFAQDAKAVVSEFRQRCGCTAPFAGLMTDRLLDDLVTLRKDDCRTASARFAHPVLSLQGGLDPILPAELRERAFGSAASVIRVSVPDGGHLLPLTDARSCAEQLRHFASGCQ